VCKIKKKGRGVENLFLFLITTYSRPVEVLAVLYAFAVLGMENN
jgi:hypothetical protein